MTAARGWNRRSVGDDERRMVEGSLFPRDPTIAQRVLQEIDERRLVFGFEIELLDPLRRIGEIAATAVEVHHGLQVLLAAVVEVRRPQPDVAEAWRLEGAVVYRRAALRERSSVRAQAGPARIFRGRTHADPVEALIATVLVDGPVLVEEAHRRVAHLRARVALHTLALAGESVEAPLLAGRQGLLVPCQEAVQGGLIGDQRRHVGLDGLTPDSGERVRRVGGCGRAERVGDELKITAVQSRIRPIRQPTQRAVLGMDELELQRLARKQLGGEGVLTIEWPACA